jgi:CRP-like cAMP-binding protein
MLALPPAECTMSEKSEADLAPMVRKLNLWKELAETDRQAVLALPFTTRRLEPGQYLVWDGDKPQYACLLLSGFAFRHKHAGNGGRQILSIHMKGDIVDLQNSLLGVADHNVQMLTAGEVAMIPADNVREIAFSHPTVGMAMWYETLVEGSIFREWVLNIGRRDARTRIAHLLCEFALRLEVAELGQQTGYELPLTQEQLADAVALTPVHVNRTLMKLEEDGLINRTKRVISITDWKKLAKEGDFQPRYLHLDSPNGSASGKAVGRA